MKTAITYFIIFVSIINIKAQCFPDQHSTNWFDQWISCSEKDSPNEARGSGHWILYNLGYKYALGNSHWWNSNEASAIQNGVKRFAIDVSLDGDKWEELATFELPMASGKNDYQGVTGPYLDKVAARYILLTALENHGGPCYSFGEMKINVDILSETEDVNPDAYCLSMKAFPNPFQYRSTIEIKSNCGNANKLTIEDALGRVVAEYEVSDYKDNQIELNGRNMSPGVYFLKTNNGLEQSMLKLIKIE